MRITHRPAGGHGPGDGSGPGAGRGQADGHRPGQDILNVGRKTRSISAALRRALEARDRGCRFPGCGSRFTDGHHIRHWADGGETSLANCLLLCPHHHRLVHEGRWRIVPATSGGVPTLESPTFIDPRGGMHFDGRWRPPTLEPEVLADPAGALADLNRRHGADPGPLAASARWKRERDIPDAVHFAALEALA